jgi:2-desacetyl-2-hydroxyethyl bacteriochlorophyllide A dehydrogenase
MARAVVISEPGVAHLREQPVADAGPGEVRLRSRYTLMSTGTEGTAFGGRFAPGTHWAGFIRYPFQPGYSCLGIVESVGAGVDSVMPGERVVARAPHVSHAVVAADRCTRVPDGLADEQAVWFALAKIAFVGVHVGHVRPGSRVLIAGAGPIGQMAVRWAAAAAAAEVTVVDTARVRLGHAERGGATRVLDLPLDEADLAGGAPEVVIDSTGNPAVLPAALRTAADRGQVVLLGDPGAPAEQRLTSDVMIRGVTIAGAHDSYTVGDPRWDNDRAIVRLFFRLAATGRFPLDGLLTHRFAPQECQAAYDLAAGARADTMGIVFDWT